MITNARDVGCEKRDSANSAATAPYHANKFFDHAVGFVVTTSELLEQCPLFIGQLFAHGSKQQCTPSKPRWTSQHCAK